MTSQPGTLQDIDGLEQQIGVAEHALDAALRTIESAPRANKVTVTEAVERALERLHAARSALASLHEIIAEDSK